MKVGISLVFDGANSKRPAKVNVAKLAQELVHIMDPVVARYDAEIEAHTVWLEYNLQGIFQHE